MMIMRNTLPFTIGAAIATTKGMTARSANRMIRLPGRMTDRRIATGTSTSELAIAAGWPMRMAESSPT
ncbi:hypothetical protein D3C83_319140 [compost metagenome]